MTLAKSPNNLLPYRSVLIDGEVASEVLVSVLDDVSTGVSFAKGARLAVKYDVNTYGMPVLALADSTGSKSVLNVGKTKMNGGSLPTPFVMSAYQIETAPDAYLAAYVSIDNADYDITLEGTDPWTEGLTATIKCNGLLGDPADAGEVAEKQRDTVYTAKIKVIDFFNVLGETYTPMTLARSIKGVFVKHNGEYAIYPTEAIEGSSEATEVANIAGLKAMADGTRVKLVVDGDVKVNWNNGGFFVIADETGAILLSKSLTSNFSEFANKTPYYGAIADGDSVKGYITALFTHSAEGTPMLEVGQGIASSESKLTFSTGTAPTATTMDIATAKTATLGQLINLYDAIRETYDITGTYGEMTATDLSESSSIKIYDFLNELAGDNTMLKDEIPVGVSAKKLQCIAVERNGEIVLYPYGGEDALTTASVRIPCYNNSFTYSSKYALDFSNSTMLTPYRAKASTTAQEATLYKMSIVPPVTGMVIYKDGAASYEEIPTKLYLDNSILEIDNDLVAQVKSNYSFPMTNEDDATKTNCTYQQTGGSYSTGYTYGFKPLTKDGYMSANTAYLPMLTSAISDKNAEIKLTIAGDTPPTSIGEVRKSVTNGSIYYNLSGQRVSQPVKGLYIVNGKKVVVK